MSGFAAAGGALSKSIAPTSPSCKPLSDVFNTDHGLVFSRQWSGASTEVPWSPAFGPSMPHFSRAFSEESPAGDHHDASELAVLETEVLEHDLMEVKASHKQRYGEDPDSEVDADAMEEQEILDQDGTPWVCTIGRGIEHQREAYNARVDSLEESLAEAKALYKQTYGEDPDSEVDSDAVEEQDVLDQDGTPWLLTIGHGIEHQREAYNARVDSLEDSLAEVKALYKQKFGEDPDSEVDSDAVEEQDILDQDGTPWVCTIGRGIEQQREAYNVRVDSLQDSLAEVKALYKQKFGEDPDSEVDSDAVEEQEILDQDGAPWVRTIGRGIEHQRESYNVRMDSLEGSLAQVKALYTQKYGEDPDSEVDSGAVEEQEILDQDGAPWVRTIGSGIEHQREEYNARVDSLEDSLAQVKALYKQKYGEDPNSEEDSDSVDEQEMLNKDSTR